MSMTYIPKNQIKVFCSSQFEDGSFNTNSAGGILISVVHLHLDLPNPFETDSKTSKLIAQSLKCAEDERIIKCLEMYRYLWDDSDKNFVQWIRNWQRFLDECGGYTTS